MAHMENTRRRSAKELADTGLKNRPHQVWLRLEHWAPVVLVGAVLAIWELAVRTGRLSALFFPAPSVIVRTLYRLLIDGRLIVNAGATLSRVLVGFALGGMTGMVIGLLMGWSRRLRAIVDPLIAAAHPVPKIAILPLIMIIFGIGESSKMIVVAVAAFFPMLINTMAGVRQIHPIHFEVAKNYGASMIKVFTRVVIPGSLPLMLTGMRLALNIALLLTIAVELVAAQKGLGAMVWLAWETLRTEELYASIVVTAGFGISFNLILQRLTQYLVPWKVERLI
jgi:ABC-type nitrate/sulfonate/bicarbonate transport system permease component